MNDVEQRVRDETNQLLLARSRILAWVIAAGVLADLAIDVLVGRITDYPYRMVVEPLGLAMVAVYLWVIRRPAPLVPPRALAFVGSAWLCLFVLALSVEAVPDMAKINLLAYSVIVLGAAILLPWGISTQVVLAAFVLASMLSSNYIVTGELLLLDPAAIPVLATTFGLSFYVAYVLEDNRLTLTRQRHELAREKEIAERRRVDAEALAADLDAYAHAVAHDLKNPISMISGYGELLAEESENLSETGKEYLAATRTGCEKMNQIVNELLLLASVRRLGVPPTAPLDMGATVAEARRRLALAIADLDATIVAAQRWPVAIGHAPWVEEVWVNYLSNALKYGGSPPRVELGAEAGGAEQVRFWVRDNGAGLARDQAARLFQEFSRVTPSESAGHGLGLSIVKRIVEKLGGTVGVESKVGAGSRFWFTLPAA